MRRVALLLILALGLTTAVHAQTDTEPLFTPLPDPVVTNGDIRYTDPGAVVAHDGQFHMFFNVFDGWPAPVEIKHAVSDDGLTWTQGDEVVLSDDQVDYAGLTVLASSALVEDDGTWVLYFYTWDSYSSSGAGSIGRATATDPNGPWTPDAEPVLLPDEDSWDSAYVTSPSVVKDETGYRMYYEGADSANHRAVGLATSDDGIHWTKQDGPVIGEPGVTGEDGALHNFWQPNVIQTPEGWFMQLKTAIPVRPVRFTLITATSEDGIDWQVSPDQLTLMPNQVDGGNAIWFTGLVHDGEQVYDFFELARGSGTEVYVATLDSQDLPTPE
jgi:sucrose-6-phosphate hydrolase SacC (GH32 family)